MKKGLRPLFVADCGRAALQHLALMKKGLRRALPLPQSSPQPATPCPDEEGIKTADSHSLQFLLLQHLALMKKGLRRTVTLRYHEESKLQHLALMKKGLRRQNGGEDDDVRDTATPCPDEEGIKTMTPLANRKSFPLQHLALMKKGLRHEELLALTAVGSAATPCPDEEGIKTHCFHGRRFLASATPCPDEEGIKTGIG